jgi:WD40 repeat protein
MKIDDRLFPNAQTKHSTLVLEARNSNDELKTVAEIVAESWKKGDKNHLMIEGEGGIGKTVTLLSIPDKFTPFPVPAIYIPLHELPQGDDPIERYIKKKVLNNKEDLFGQLLDLLDNPWDKGPQLLLLLDGFNEIAAENRQTISEDIKYWSEFQGIQIVTSSRYDIHTYVALSYDYSAIKLQPLSNTTVDAYLKSMKVRIPTDSAVKELITIPLLLTLYVKTELILEQRETDSAEFREAKNAGSIVWNYMQCELWHFGKEDEDAKNAIIAMEFVAPYMAWQMQQNSLFFLNQEQFNKYLENAYKLLGSHFNKSVDFRFHIQNALQKADGIPSLKLTRSLLEKQLCLFVKTGNSYKLMHQQFRDALAAIYLINSIYLDGDSRPTEWDSTVDHYVVQFVADLISEDEANRLWEQNRTSPQLDSATRNQLELQSRLHNCDFSNLDFSGLDLSNISLYPYRVGNAMLKLPADSKRMTDTRLSEKTFYAEAHGSKVNAVTVPPDGKCIVSGSDDNTIRIWDLETGAQLRVIKGHINGVNAITVTPDRTRIISGSSDNTIRVWGWETESQLMAIEGHKSSVNAITVTPNGKCIVSGSKDSTIRIWDLENGAPIGKPLQGHEGSVNAITVTPDGKIIVSGSDDNTIRIWDLETGLQLRAIKGHKSSVNAITLTPDGKHIISGSSDKTIRIWDFGNGALVGEPLQGHEDWVNAVAVTPDSKLIVSGSLDNTIRVWDLETGVQLKIIKGYKEGYKSGVNTIALTLNNKREYIVSGFNHGAIQVWDLKTGDQLIAIEKYKRGVNAATISLDSKRIVSGSEDKTIRVWDLETRVLLNAFEGHKSRVNAVSLTPDGKYIISGSDDKSIRVWSLETGAHLINIEGHEDIVKIVKVTPSGKHIISSSDDNTIRIWDLETGEYIRSLQGIKSTVYFIAITPNGKFVISEGRDHTIYIWDFETGCLVNVPKENDEWENSVAVMSSRNHFAYGVADGTIRIISKDTSSTHTIRVLPLSVVGLDFSKAEISDDELKETLRQNGAKV